MRRAVYLWAFPLTLIGYFLLVLSGGWRHTEVYKGARWFVPRYPWWWPRRFCGMCMGDVVIVRSVADMLRVHLSQHELHHRKQCHCLGPLLLVLYPLGCLLGWLAHGKPYLGNPFELAARLAADQEVRL